MIVRVRAKSNNIDSPRNFVGKTKATRSHFDMFFNYRKIYGRRRRTVSVSTSDVQFFFLSFFFFIPLPLRAKARGKLNTPPRTGLLRTSTVAALVPVHDFAIKLTLGNRHLESRKYGLISSRHRGFLIYVRSPMDVSY